MASSRSPVAVRKFRINVPASLVIVAVHQADGLSRSGLEQVVADQPRIGLVGLAGHAAENLSLVRSRKTFKEDL